jgi:hypothetical protein
MTRAKSIIRIRINLIYADFRSVGKYAGNGIPTNCGPALLRQSGNGSSRYSRSNCAQKTSTPSRIFLKIKKLFFRQ